MKLKHLCHSVYLVIAILFAFVTSPLLWADHVIYQGETFTSPEELISETIEEIGYQWTGKKCRITDRIFPNGLPWVFELKTLKDSPTPESEGDVPRGTISESFLEETEDFPFFVVIGNLENYISLWDLPYLSVRVRPGASMEIADAKAEFFLYDVKGTHFKNVNKRIIVPLNTEPYLIRVKTAAALKQLRKEIEKAEIRNVSALELDIEDLKKPVGSPNNIVSVNVRNILNRKAEGKIQLLAPGLFFWDDVQKIKLKPGQKKTLEFKADMTLSKVRDGNNYPIVLIFTEKLDDEELPVVKFADTIHVRIPEDSPLEPLPIVNPLKRPKGKLPPTAADDPWRPVLLHLDWMVSPITKKVDFGESDVEQGLNKELNPDLSEELEKRLKQWEKEGKH